MNCVKRSAEATVAIKATVTDMTNRVWGGFPSIKELANHMSVLYVSISIVVLYCEGTSVKPSEEGKVTDDK